ncbi:MAG: substrate-binding domain-containing protein [Candidatus Humimicrobiaceae bacterium]
MKKVKLLIVLVLIAAIIAAFIILPGCKKTIATTTAAETTAAVTTAAETTAAETTVAASKIVPKEGGYVVAVSNSFITHSWRTQMVNDLQKSIEYYRGKGLVKEFLLQHSGPDLNLQTTQIQNYISMKPDIIIVDPLSNTALNPILEQAVDAGIMVIVSDEPVTSTAVFQVMPTHDVWMYKLSKYVFDRMGSKGDIVYISGIKGAPASDQRDTGFEKALSEYPDIKLLTQIWGSWDPATAQQATADILAAYPKIDGVVAQDGECLAAIRAFEAAGRDIPIINGEGFRPFFEYWTANLDKGFTSYAIANGPGFAMTTALGVGLRMLMGATFKEEFLPAGEKIFNFDHRFEITDENVVQALEDHTKYRGLEDYIDEVWKMKDVNALFNESADLDAMLK